MSWNDEQIAQLRKMWADGLSCSQIAGELGSGITRNAVIGKVHRLKLSGRPKTYTLAAANAARSNRVQIRIASISAARGSQAARAPRVTPPRRPRSRASAEKLAKAIGFDREKARFHCFRAEETSGIAFIDIRNGLCRWPLGDQLNLEEFRFCGEVTDEPSVYCQHHHLLSIAPWQPKAPQSSTDKSSSRRF